MIVRNFSDGTRVTSREYVDGAMELSLEVGGIGVSRIVIVPMLMRIGAAVVRMDGIGGVETDEQYRRRGYARRLMEIAVERMREGDAALSTLYGIQDFYPKFGYATAGPEYTVIFNRPEDYSAIPALPRGWTCRSFRADDLSILQRIYHANTSAATGALVRHDAGDELPENRRLMQASPAAMRIGRRAWKRLEKLAADPGDDECRVLGDESGAIVGYAWRGKSNWWINFRERYAPDAFHIGEVMAAHPVAADAVLIGCLSWMTEVGPSCSRMELVLPPENPVAAAAAYEGGQFHAAHSRRGQFMGRVLNVERLVRQVQPELSARVRGACLPFRGRLTFRTDEGEASLWVAPEGVSMEGGSCGRQLVVELPQDILARLILGAFDTADVLARLPDPPAAETAALLKVFFPRRYPHIYPMDRF